tara:strand:- start:9001 stop:10161 length:1161 start_codon:yes stop_codon:yes gene_type:complete
MPSNKDDDDDEKDIAAFASVLVDQSRPIRDRFRALFTLRSMTGRPGAADALISALTMKTLNNNNNNNNNNNSNDDDDDPAFLAAAKTTRLRADALFRHEVAFALGQMQSKKATSALISVLKNECEHGMTRHECAEALGAIGDESAVDVLREMHEDETQCREVRETASLALRRIEHVTKKKSAIVGARVGSKKETTAVGIAEKDDDDDDDDDDVRHAYSVDPVPAMEASVETDTLAAIILDDTADIWDRYGAMFALRNRAQETFGLAKTRENERVVELCSSTLGKTLRSETVHSALLKHEICYVLGQLREDDDNDIAREALFDCLEDPNEHAMVRHEAAEAIGSRGGAGAEALLRKYLSCEDRVVRESCEVALDMLKENQEEDVVFL